MGLCKEGQKRNMWMIGYATSTDGVHFQKGGPPTWTLGASQGLPSFQNPYSSGHRRQHGLSCVIRVTWWQLLVPGESCSGS